jgi:ATP-dependent DNA helicase RecQ
MSSKFQLPEGEIVAVRVAAMLVRHAREGGQDGLRCQSWELVLPEIEYVPR